MNNDVTKMAFFAVTDPKLMTVDFAQIEQKAAENRKARDLANPPRKEEPRREYNRLRQELYNLQQHAKSREVSMNNEVGNVRHFETRVNDLLKQKKDAIAAGALGQERFLEHQLVMAEDELQNARERLVKEQRYNAGAVRELRAFAGHARLAELKKELAL